MTLDPMAPRPPITSPRDLALPSRFLSSALSLLDGINQFSDQQPGELEAAEHDRASQVAAFVAARAVLWAPANAARRAEWRARYGGKEAEGPTIGVILTPKAQKFEGRGFRLKAAVPASAPADAAGKLHLVVKRKAG